MAEERFWQGAMFWALTLIVTIGLLVFWLAVVVSAKEFVSIGVWPITSYQARTQECDSEPDIGAFGRVAVQGNPTGFWFAGNRFKKGDRIVIPELTGNIVWECRDRTARKVSHRIDLLMPQRGSYVTIGGVRHCEVFVLK